MASALTLRADIVNPLRVPAFTKRYFFHDSLTPVVCLQAIAATAILWLVNGSTYRNDTTYPCAEACATLRAWRAPMQAQNLDRALCAAPYSLGNRSDKEPIGDARVSFAISRAWDGVGVAAFWIAALHPPFAATHRAWLIGLRLTRYGAIFRHYD